MINSASVTLYELMQDNVQCRTAELTVLTSLVSKEVLGAHLELWCSYTGVLVTRITAQEKANQKNQWGLERGRAQGS